MMILYPWLQGVRVTAGTCAKVVLREGDGQQPTFVKLAEGKWEGTDDDLELFRALTTTAPRPYVMEIKKPASATAAAASAARREREG